MSIPAGTLCGNCDTPLQPRAHGKSTVPHCPGCRSFWSLKVLRRVQRFRKAAPRARVLSLTYEPNGSAHNDVVLRVGDWAHRSDSYYYALDEGAGTDAEESIRGLLRQWAHSLREALPGDVLYWPHDFSDQGTGWLRCDVRSEGQVLVSAGYSRVEGYSFFPSSFGDAARAMSDFCLVDGFAEVHGSRDDVLADIAGSLRALDSAT